MEKSLTNSQTIDLPKKLHYNGDFSSVIRLEDLRFQTIVNAVAATYNLKHAARELGVSEKTVIDFCGHHCIGSKIRLQMRAHFSTLEKVRIKYKYDHGESDKKLRSVPVGIGEERCNSSP